MMKLYAIRDRLLDYFMQPFVGPSDHAVKAAVADNVNNEESTHAVSKAPHQFELWRIAEIDETTGQVSGDREYLCDLSSLLRGGVRRAGDAAAAALARATQNRSGGTGSPASAARANEPAAESQAPAEGLESAPHGRGPH